MSSFVSFIPSSILRRAFAFGGEYAWSRDDALKVISIAEREGLAILGVDIWVPASSGGPIIPTPFVYDWDSTAWTRNPNVPRAAADFIRTFEWDPADAAFLNREPYFNLTVDDHRG